jgi:hypothetical protein
MNWQSLLEPAICSRVCETLCTRSGRLRFWLEAHASSNNYGLGVRRSGATRRTLWLSSQHWSRYRSPMR